MKYKIGDEVTVKPLEWYNYKKDNDGNIEHEDDLLFIDEMIPFLGKKGIVVNIHPDCYELSFDGTICADYQFCDYMLEHKEPCKFCEKIKESYKEEQFVRGDDHGYLFIKNGNLMVQDYSGVNVEEGLPKLVFELKHCTECGEKLK